MLLHWVVDFPLCYGNFCCFFCKKNIDLTFHCWASEKNYIRCRFVNQNLFDSLPSLSIDLLKYRLSTYSASPNYVSLISHCLFSTIYLCRFGNCNAVEIFYWGAKPFVGCFYRNQVQFTWFSGRFRYYRYQNSRKTSSLRSEDISWWH
jgi:hypothetical protein